MKQEFDTEYYSLEEAAKLLGLQQSTLKKNLYIKKGHPPVISPARGVYLFPKYRFHKWLHDRMETEIAS